MSTKTLPFNIITNRILEQSGYSDIDLIKIADRKEISTAIKKAGFDASKSRVCIQEINDYFTKQDKKIKEDTAKIRSVQYLPPSASEATAKRKKIIDNLLGNSNFIVLNSQEFDKLLLDFSISKTGFPVCEYVVRDSCKAMGYYYTTAIGTRQRGCYISKTKDSRDVVKRRVSKVIKSMNRKPYDQVEKIRKDYMNRLKSKEYVILDNIQFEDILLKISPYEAQPIDTTTFRKLISDNDCCFVTIDSQRYYYVSSKHIYSRSDVFKLREILNEELRRNPRVFGNFRDDIAKLLIHADIVYIKDFDGVEEEFLRELFKDVNYDEATIQKCLNAIHNYNITWKHYNGNLVNVDNTSVEVKKEEPMKSVDNAKDMIDKINNLTNNIRKGEDAPSVTVTKEDFDGMKNTSSDETKKMSDTTSDQPNIPNPAQPQPTPIMDNDATKSNPTEKTMDDISFSEFVSNSIKTGMPTNIFKNELRSFIANHPDKLTATEMESAKAFLNGPNPFGNPFSNPFGNPFGNIMSSFQMMSQQPQIQQAPKMLNPTISGTCPCCHATFTIPATINHKVYCFSCGTLIEY